MRITAEAFGNTTDGRAVTAFTLENGRGLSARVLDYGAAVQRLLVPDREGTAVDVVLGYDDLAGYEAGTSWLGATVGRYANRVANAAFPLGGRLYHLPKNEGENHLHGTFERRVFDAEILGDAVAMRLVSPDGEEGFPGTLSVTVTYSLTAEDALRVEYRAETDADTVVNLTNHSYFNLAGHGNVREQLVRLSASRFVEVGAGSLPTGRLLPVSGTAMDLRTEKRIGEGLASGEAQLALCGGYDHAFVFDKGPELAPCGGAYCPETGICLTMSTTQPGVQFYTGNHLPEDGAPCGKDGARYPRFGGFCLEAQRLPDSPNQPDFPSALLRPGELYHEITEYRFAVR